MLKGTNHKGNPELGGMGTPLALGDKLCFATVAVKFIVTDLEGTRRCTHQLGGTCHVRRSTRGGH